MPRTPHELPERRDRSVLRLIGPCSDLDGAAHAARLLYARQRRRPECEPVRSVFALPVMHETPVTRRPAPHSETRLARVPDRILEYRRRQPGDAGVGQTPPLRSHGLSLQGRADGIGRLAHHGVGQMGILQRRRRIAVSEKPADGQHRFALRQGHAGVCVPKIVEADIA